MQARDARGESATAWCSVARRGESARCGERIPGVDRVATHALGGARVAGAGLARPPVSVVREKRGFQRSRAVARALLLRFAAVVALTPVRRRCAGCGSRVRVVFVRLRCLSRMPPHGLVTGCEGRRRAACTRGAHVLPRLPGATAWPRRALGTRFFLKAGATPRRVAWRAASCAAPVSQPRGASTAPPLTARPRVGRATLSRRMVTFLTRLCPCPCGRAAPRRTRLGPVRGGGQLAAVGSGSGAEACARVGDGQIWTSLRATLAHPTPHRAVRIAGWFSAEMGAAALHSLARACWRENWGRSRHARGVARRSTHAMRCISRRRPSSPAC